MSDEWTLVRDRVPASAPEREYRTLDYYERVAYAMAKVREIGAQLGSAVPGSPAELALMADLTDALLAVRRMGPLVENARTALIREHGSFTEWVVMRR